MVPNAPESTSVFFSSTVFYYIPFSGKFQPHPLPKFLIFLKKMFFPAKNRRDFRKIREDFRKMRKSLTKSGRKF